MKNVVFLFFILSTTLHAQVTVSTFAGSTTAGKQDGTGTDAGFYHPSGIDVDASGNIYVADQGNHLIRKISPDGVVTTLAGSGTYGNSNGTGTDASFDLPSDVAVDADGIVYVADFSNNMIRKITTDGVVTTFAGSGSPGRTDKKGTEAKFYGPTGVAVDADGNVYVTDQKSNAIRKITPDGQVTTLAGGAYGYENGAGADAKFFDPYGIAVDLSGNVLVADQSNNVIRSVNATTGVVATIAGSGVQGSDDKKGTAATFKLPSDMEVDNNGYIYVADFNNELIRKISPTGDVTTVAGLVYQKGSVNGSSDVASFDSPIGIALNAEGTIIYIADYYNNMIRKIELNAVATGTQKNSILQSAKLFPNPALDKLMIDLAAEVNGTIQVSDLQGNEILNQDIHSKQAIISTNALENGMYFVKITSAGTTAAYRFVVAR